MKYVPFVGLATLSLLLVGCMTVPLELQGPYIQTTPGSSAATAVRWGGQLVTTLNQPQETCFEILGTRLSEASSRPRDTSQSGARFVACQPGFIDPQAHDQGTEVTVIGHVVGHIQRSVGAYPLSEARVQIEAIHWWPARPVFYQDDSYRGFYGWGAPWGVGYLRPYDGLFIYRGPVHSGPHRGHPHR